MSGTDVNNKTASTTFTVTVSCTPPSVTQNPADQTVTYGANASFSAAASGDPAPSVQWQVNTGSGFTNILGETKTTLALTNPTVAMSANTYRAVFHSSCAPDATTTTATLTVNRADAVISVTGYDVTYDGASHTATGTATGVNSEDLSGSLDLSGTTHTGAGTYTDSWSFSNANYNLASGQVNDHIGKAAPGCSIIGYTGVYDGDVHGANGTCSAPGTLDLGATFTDAPGGTAHWTFTSSDPNYDNSTGDVAIDINKADAICTVSGYTGVYDDSAHGASGSCAGVGGADLSAQLDLGSSFTDVPGGTADWTFDGGTNYHDQHGSVTIDISKAVADCTVTGYSGVYDAASHGATGSCTGVGDAVLSGLDLGDSFKNVPGGTAHWTFTNNNYNDQSGDVAIDISKADAACSIIGYSGTYDGTARGLGGSCSGFGGEDAGTLDLGAGFTNVPGGTAHWAFTGNGNYNDQGGDLQVMIAKADPTCSVTGYNVTYDANAHSATGSCEGVSDETLAGLDLSGTTHTNAGDYPSDPWTFTDSTGNYNDTSGTVSDHISKADPTCSVTGYNVVLDGNAHTATGSCTGVGGETLIALDLSGTTHTNAGDYPSDPWTFTDSTGNYNDMSGTVHDNIHFATSGNCLGELGHAVLQPVNFDGSSVFKKGSTVPVKFRVCDANGNSMGAGGPVVKLGTDGHRDPVFVSKSSGTGSVDEAVYSTTPDTDFRWDPTARQWIFNFNTRNLVSGVHYCYRIDLIEGSSIYFDFGVK